MDIGQAVEAGLQALAHGGAPDVAATPRVGATWHFEHGIVGEQGHDGIEIVGVKRRDEGLEGAETVHD
jgi:hypothetical protein